jgi:hypothetical protein
MADQFSLGPGADQKYCRHAISSDSPDQQLCLLHLRSRTGRQLSSLCRSTLWLESGRPNGAHSRSSRILSNGLWKGPGGSRDKRPLCLLDSIPASPPRPISCSSHPPNASNPRPAALSKAQEEAGWLACIIVRSEGLIQGGEPRNTSADGLPAAMSFERRRTLIPRGRWDPAPDVSYRAAGACPPYSGNFHKPGRSFLGAVARWPARKR